MLKEIFEQPEALFNSMKGRLNIEQKDVLLSGIIDYKDEILKSERIIICLLSLFCSWQTASTF